MPNASSSSSSSSSALSGLRLGLVGVVIGDLALKADLLAAASFFMSATLILAPRDSTPARPRKWPAGCGNSHHSCRWK